MKVKVKKIIGISFLGFIAVVIREIYLTADYLYNFVIARNDKLKYKGLLNLSAEEKLVKRELKKEKDKIDYVLKSALKKEFYIKSFDNNVLYAKGYFQNTLAEKSVIIVHGYCQDSESMDYAACEFFKNGFNVLLPDCRGHGKSGGKYIAMGWHDRFDVILWCRLISEINSNMPVVLYGVSMGAAAVMMAAGEKLPNNVKCIIEDCGYTSCIDEFKYQAEKIYRTNLIYVLIYSLEIICRIRAGFFLHQASAFKQMKKCRIPTLFLHGEDDMLVPVKMVYDLYTNAVCSKDMYIIKNAGHGVSAMVGKENWKRVFDFVNRQITK